MCIIQQILRGPSEGALRTQHVIMLKHCFFLIIKVEYYLFQILQIIQLKVISYLDTDHLPFLEKGEGGVDGWHDMYKDSPSGNIKLNQSQIWFTGMQKLQHGQYHCQS